MELEKSLLSLLLVLVAALIAAETAERLKQPAVLGEILAGILIGPSVLGLVHGNDLLKLIGELGAILLLFEVGMHMDLRELGRVGRDSLRVAAIGIAFPMAFSLLTLNALGVPPGVSLFIAGAVTATSVGITARVFGDLRALATPEARTVLGAAVADDVGGLLILTIVTALASGGGVTAGALVGIVGGALAFVLAATAGGAWAAPGVFRRLSAGARTDATLMLVALAFALALALAASALHLAPIVGAFIAGLAVSRTHARDELGRRLVPLGHFFVPVFFLLIGIETRLDVFARPSVLGIASVLTIVAIAGKLASGLGVRRGSANRLLVGVAMVPRGEVGLIFAGIGLTAGILDSRYYGILIAVVMVTTLVTPPWVRRLIGRKRRRAVALSKAIAEPPGGWLNVTEDEIDLNAEPPDLLAGRLGLEAAVACASRQPGPWLLQWLSSAENSETHWDRDLRKRFFDLLKFGNVRSWRFLQVTGLLDAWLPVLGEAAAHRKRDPFNLEPGGDLRWNLLEDLHSLVDGSRHGALGPEGAERFSALWNRVDKQDLVFLAALAGSLFAGDSAAAGARQLANSIGLDEESTSFVEFLVAERQLLTAAARRLDTLGEDSVLELAAHIRSRTRVDALFILALASTDMAPWEQERLHELFDLVQGALALGDLEESDSADPVELRRGQAKSVLGHLSQEIVDDHLRSAPRRYLVAHGPEVVARHVQMTETPLGRLEVRLEAEPAAGEGSWTVHVVTRDRKGLLAGIAGAFATAGISVEEAFVSTWRNGAAIDVFKVSAPKDVDWDEIRSAIVECLGDAGGNGAQPEPVEGTVDIDNLASPWHTILEIRSLDRTGLLHRVACALWKANLQIHMAVVHTQGDVAVDIFYVTGRAGGKLDETEQEKLRSALSGASSRRWWMHRRATKQRA